MGNSKTKSEKVDKAVCKAEKEAKKTSRKAEKKTLEEQTAQTEETQDDSAEEPEVGASDDEAESKDESKKSSTKKSAKAKQERSEWCVWIGNLPYTVTKEDIKVFFKDCGGTITRIKLPKKNGKSSGFAYVDFDTQDAVSLALAHSEQKMGKRAVLIKDAKDFNKTGAPTRTVFNSAAKEDTSKNKTKRNIGKNPPSATLFVGNLGFDVKKSDLKAIFKPFGELVGVRVATFEDNPEKCRGFGYVDFKYAGDATKALMSPDIEKIHGRRVRMEYAGETATRKGRPWEFDPKVNPNLKRQSDSTRDTYQQGDDADNDEDYESAHAAKKQRRLVTENMAETKLQGLPVQFEGQKITFGD
ncbi:Nucleolar protein 13 [Coemansia spiralis]|uniref:Nucleolar protein 13 n=2 Tax=Coemansia TaxID=4863 RepID=A0A9W8KW22_9FUNG|nr:hypothetical protein BX070DRAFT_229384 [Coemansia spiralis]KAJ1989427.1 Nucleolar protein 13 [Coemansia umbellata]KAJ2620363.1 Nucleolar protein 13 [Coemansia sp. RSA 1358]KAJ2670376.1 Nucleolar protein 13 [Coemansia spiralis]